MFKKSKFTYNITLRTENFILHLISRTAMRNVFFTFVTDFHELFLPRHHFENMFTKPVEIQGFHCRNQS